jgi:hypothetical protein
MGGAQRYPSFHLTTTMGSAKSPIHPASFIAGGSIFFTVNLAQRRLAVTVTVHSTHQHFTVPPRELGRLRSILAWARTPQFQKNSDFLKVAVDFPPARHYVPVLFHPQRGVSRSSRTRVGMRWTRRRRARKALQGGNPLNGCSVSKGFARMTRR